MEKRHSGSHAYENVHLANRGPQYENVFESPTTEPRSEKIEDPQEPLQAKEIPSDSDEEDRAAFENKEVSGQKFAEARLASVPLTCV